MRTQVACFLSLATLPALAHAQRYQSFGSGWGVFAVSDDGQVGCGTSGGPDFTSARWTWESGLTRFGHDAGFGASNSAWAISGNGSVLFGHNRPSSGPREVYRWTGPGTYESLGNLPGFGTSVVLDADRTGSVAVGYGNLDGYFGMAWVWTEGGGMRRLGVTRQGHRRSEAHGVSADGSMVVGWSTGGGESDAFVWTASNGMRVLQSRPDDMSTGAWGINSDGSIIVGATGSDRIAPCLWRNGVLEILPSPGNDRYCYLTSVSDDGSVIMGIDSTSQAYIWTPDGQVRTLADYLRSFGVPIEPGDRLGGGLASLKVSADGRTFLATSDRYGNIVATIPAPGTLIPVVWITTLARRPRRLCQ